MTAICARCDTEAPADLAFCPDCGQPRPPERVRPKPVLRPPSPAAQQRAVQVVAAHTDPRPYSTWSIVGTIFAFVAPPLGMLVSLFCCFGIDEQTMRGRKLAFFGLVIGALLTF